MAIQLFSNDLGIDLGTSNVLIYADDQGIVVREPCVIAMDKNTGYAAAERRRYFRPGNDR